MRASTLFNGASHQQIMFMLPDPSLMDDRQIRGGPDRARLARWSRLRATYLGLSESGLVAHASEGFRHR
ncbi:MAG: hypothetical protein AMXMBFR23_02320 [Chloroflexota bacterium]